MGFAPAPPEAILLLVVPLASPASGSPPEDNAHVSWRVLLLARVDCVCRAERASPVIPSEARNPGSVYVPRLPEIPRFARNDIVGLTSLVAGRHGLTSFRAPADREHFACGRTV